MNIIIMGCSRVGARLAAMLDGEGHDVTVLDTEPYCFRHLPKTFKGTAITGNGLDEDVLRKSGIEKADVFIAVTEEDNRNLMAAQIAKQIFNVPRVICQVYDPVREELCQEAGIEVVIPTKIIADILYRITTGEEEE